MLSRSMILFWACFGYSKIAISTNELVFLLSKLYLDDGPLNFDQSDASRLAVADGLVEVEVYFSNLEVIGSRKFKSHARFSHHFCNNSV
ncbi:hypothetical protein L596_004645 [Steinernema carpocapsae]|uniref:Uncharacterized protein n=1 Tax=Steinernema carpocapsae TaxID=34508 RepID=A0A4V6I8E6_STECR|nr:hypothetical protein L596_004645 [Steinernema carpocapsae]